MPNLSVRFKSATVDEFIEHHSHDISKGGMFIKTQKPFASGTLLKFEVRIKDDQPVIAGVGRVVWKREASQAGPDKPAGMGVKFIKLEDAKSKEVIERIIRERGNDGPQFEESESDPPPPSDEIEQRGDGGGAFFPSSPDAGMAAPPAERTVIKQADEILADALKGAGLSAANVLASPEPPPAAASTRKATIIGVQAATPYSPPVRVSPEPAHVEAPAPAPPPAATDPAPAVAEAAAPAPVEASEPAPAADDKAIEDLAATIAVDPGPLPAEAKPDAEESSADQSAGTSGSSKPRTSVRPTKPVWSEAPPPPARAHSRDQKGGSNNLLAFALFLVAAGLGLVAYLLITRLPDRAEKPAPVASASPSVSAAASAAMSAAASASAPEAASASASASVAEAASASASTSVSAPASASASVKPAVPVMVPVITRAPPTMGAPPPATGQAPVAPRPPPPPKPDEY